MFIIKRDELMEAQDELRELERLLNEAWLRRRNLLKKKSMQGWWDWMWEFIIKRPFKYFFGERKNIKKQLLGLPNKILKKLKQ